MRNLTYIALVCAEMVALLSPSFSWAQTVFAKHSIRPASVLTMDDFVVRDVVVAGALEDPAQAIGLEARVAIFAGQPVRQQDLAPLALVARNQLVEISYLKGGLNILTEGRSLERGHSGERIQVMNLESRTVIVGLVKPDGSIEVAK